MATTAKARAPRRPEQAGSWPPSVWAAPPLTTEERLQRIALAESQLRRIQDDLRLG
jgi:hypothetical protein